MLSIFICDKHGPRNLTISSLFKYDYANIEIKLKKIMKFTFLFDKFTMIFIRWQIVLLSVCFIYQHSEIYHNSKMKRRSNGQVKVNGELKGIDCVLATKNDNSQLSG